MYDFRLSCTKQSRIFLQDLVYIYTGSENEISKITLCQCSKKMHHINVCMYRYNMYGQGNLSKKNKCRCLLKNTFHMRYNHPNLALHNAIFSFFFCEYNFFKKSSYVCTFFSLNIFCFTLYKQVNWYRSWHPNAM